jgi:hypothetical protein
MAKEGVLANSWTPFVPCGPDPRDPGSNIYRNSRYQVHVRRQKAQNGGPDLVHLSFKRLDQQISIPYRDKMRIKDAFLGAECEAVELFPARSREVDTANQFHIWGIDDTTFRFPFGFAERCVSDISLGGAVQEPWPDGERPADCLSKEELTQLFENSSGRIQS